MSYSVKGSSPASFISNPTWIKSYTCSMSEYSFAQLNIRCLCEFHTPTTWTVFIVLITAICLEITIFRSHSNYFVWKIFVRVDSCFYVNDRLDKKTWVTISDHSSNKKKMLEWPLRVLLIATMCWNLWVIRYRVAMLISPIRAWSYE